MPAKSSSRPPRTVRRLAALIPATLAIAAAGVAAVGVVAVVAKPDLLPGPGAVPAGPTVVAAGLVAVLVATLLLSRRGRRLHRERTRDALARFDKLHVCGVIQNRDVEPRPPREAAPGSERVLRLQVRSLEQALEGQDERIAEATRDGQRHALLAIAALRESVAGQPGELALSRVEAALRRIGAAPSFTRPVLGVGHTGRSVVLPAPQPLVTPDPAATAGPVVGTETTHPVAAEPAAPAERPVVAVEPVVDASPEPPVVRPVPAFAPRPVPHRSRRRFRRTVAA